VQLETAPTYLIPGLYVAYRRCTRCTESVPDAQKLYPAYRIGTRCTAAVPLAQTLCAAHGSCTRCTGSVRAAQRLYFSHGLCVRPTEAVPGVQDRYALHSGCTSRTDSVCGPRKLYPVYRIGTRCTDAVGHLHGMYTIRGNRRCGFQPHIGGHSLVVRLKTAPTYLIPGLYVAYRRCTRCTESVPGTPALYPAHGLCISRTSAVDSVQKTWAAHKLCTRPTHLVRFDFGNRPGVGAVSNRTLWDVPYCAVRNRTYGIGSASAWRSAIAARLISSTLRSAQRVRCHFV